MESEDIVTLILKRLERINSKHDACKKMLAVKVDRLEELEQLIESLEKETINDLKYDLLVYKEANETLIKKIKDGEK